MLLATPLGLLTHHLATWSILTAILGSFIAIFALIGFVVTAKWIFLKTRRSEVLVSGDEGSLELFAQQTEGLLDGFSGRERNAGATKHGDQLDESDKQDKDYSPTDFDSTKHH
jgi:hypothetical protein